MTILKKLAVAAGLSLLAVTGAQADDTDSTAQLSLKQETPIPDPNHLLGDWWGLRSSLAARGITLGFTYTSESTGNVSGGSHQTLRYADQRAIFVGVDWDKLVGAPNLSSTMVIVNRGGSSTSNAIGDYFQSSQEIYGSGGNVAFHLVMLYGQKTWGDGAVNWKFGYYPVGVDFVGSPLYCQFMSGSICSNPKGSLAFSAWPAATLGTSVRVRTGKDTTLAIGAFGYDPHLFIPPVYHTGWNIDPGRYRGVEVPVEFGWTPRFGPDGLVGHYRIGAGYTNAENRRFLGNTPGIMGDKKRGVFQFWALADQMLVRHGPGDMNGLIVLGGFYHSSADTIAYNNSVFAGLVNQGLFRSRPNDVARFMVDWQMVSPQLRQLQTAQQALGLPLANYATAPQSHEIVVEANYTFDLGRGISIMPDLQYVIRPNAQKNNKNQLLLGLKVNVNF